MGAVADTDFQSAFALVVMFLAAVWGLQAGLNRLCTKKAESIESTRVQQVSWQRAMSVWQQYWYCVRCDGVFVPGQGSIMSPDDLRQTLIEAERDNAIKSSLQPELSSPTRSATETGSKSGGLRPMIGRFGRLRRRHIAVVVVVLGFGIAAVVDELHESEWERLEADCHYLRALHDRRAGGAGGIMLEEEFAAGRFKAKYGASWFDDDEWNGSEFAPYPGACHQVPTTAGWQDSGIHKEWLSQLKPFGS